MNTLIMEPKSALIRPRKTVFLYLYRDQWLDLTQLEDLLQDAQLPLHTVAMIDGAQTTTCRLMEELLQYGASQFVAIADDIEPHVLALVAKAIAQGLDTYLVSGRSELKDLDAVAGKLPIEATCIAIDDLVKECRKGLRE